MKEVVVFVYLHDQFVPAGRLAYFQQGRFSGARFRYGQQYLEREDAFSLDPVQLPLLDKEFITPESFELFNGIRDAGPDRWGRYLLDKKYARALDELDYVTLTGTDRVGALGFSSSLYEPPEVKLHRLDLKLCLEAAEQALSDETTPALEAYLNYGPSLGGARPKATVLWNNEPYVAKFTLSMDSKNESLIEYATLSLAKKCGLNVPTIDKARISDRDIYLIKRFDRALVHGEERRIPFVSALTMTGQHESDYQAWSYLTLCNAINQFSPHPIQDKIELFKRMVFNILVNNNDDHMRNHGFLYAGDQKWGLSPLYDVVPGIIHSETRMLTMKIGDEGKVASLSNALSAAKYFDLPDSQARMLIEELTSIVEPWAEHYASCGVSLEDINKLKASF